MPTLATSVAPSRVKEKLARDEPVAVLMMHLGNEWAFETSSLMRFDVLCVDAQHGDLGPEKVERLIRAARVGESEVLVRASREEHARMGRFLDLGARGVLYPGCVSRSDAQRALTALKHPPLGDRGYSPTGPDSAYREVQGLAYIEAANANTFTVMGIGNPEGVEAATDIASLSGVDVLYFDPASFQASLAFSDGSEAAVDAARQQVAAAARAGGKHWGTVAADLDAAQRLVEAGARFVCVWSDLQFFRTGLGTLRGDLRGLGFDFSAA